jgi:hypothetical protein
MLITRDSTHSTMEVECGHMHVALVATTAIPQPSLIVSTYWDSP